MSKQSQIEPRSCCICNRTFTPTKREARFCSPGCIGRYTALAKCVVDYGIRETSAMLPEMRFEDAAVPDDFVVKMDRPSLFEMLRNSQSSYTPPV